MPSLAATALAAASVACAALGAAVGAAVAGRIVFAYGEPVTAISAADVRLDAARRFILADADGSGDLDAREFASFSLVTVELSRLNGFVALVEDAPARRIETERAVPASLSEAERTRILALGYRRFYAEAGVDAHLSRAEFVRAAARAFARHDLDGDMVLAGRELRRFVAEAASPRDAGV